MAKGEAVGLYSPESMDEGSPQEIIAWVTRELTKVSQAFEGGLARNFEVLHAAPARPREGMVVVADGTNWNPGSGAGPYAYVGGAWLPTFTVDTGSDIPSGSLFDFAGTVAPSGFLLCDGSVYAQSLYAALYAVIGNAWNTGGEGAGNFRVPDFRRRVAVGSGGSSSSALGNAVGNTGGAETHTLTQAQLPNVGLSIPSLSVSASGTFPITSGGTFYSNPSNKVHAGFNNSPTESNQTVNVSGATGGGTTGAMGSDQAHNILQPSAVVLKIIKI